MDAISKNLYTLIHDRDLKQSTVARVAGVSEGSVSGWLSGRAIPRTKALQAIAEHYGLSIDDLTSEQHGLYAQAHNLVAAPPNAIAPNQNPKRACAPLLGRVHAGDAQEPDILESEIPLPFEVWERHKGGYFLEVEGTCMNMVYPEGCYVFVDPDKAPQNGSIAVVSVDGSDYIMRKLYKGSSSLMLVAESFDDGWEDIIIQGDDHQVSMVGTIVWYQPKGELE